MRVNITYLDGTTENVSNIPTAEIASGIYAEAVTNARVESAELLDDSGQRVMPVATPCSMRYARDPRKVCRRRAGHCGLHRVARNGFVWGDRESLTH